MTQEDYEEGLLDDLYEYVEGYEEEEHCEEEDEVVHDDRKDADIFDDIPMSLQEWKQVKIGEAILMVSSEGNIKFPQKNPFYITKGYRHSGTSYRYINVEVYHRDIRRYYVHDIMWRAFYEEDPLDGWEIRHDYHTPLDEDLCFVNDLRYLDMYPEEISRLGHSV